MKHKQCLILLLTFLLCFLFPAAVSANSAEPPGFTVIVIDPPEDLSLFLRLNNGTETEPVLLNRQDKAWEAYYRFFYYPYPAQKKVLDGAVLVAEYDGKSFGCSIPAESFQTYNNLLTLDVDAQVLTNGQPAWRSAALTAMRVLLTLVIEGIIFLLFQYRKLRSWLIFLGANLFTQGVLNVLLTGPRLSSYWVLEYLIYEILILFTEMYIFTHWLRESSKGRAAAYAATANITSLIAGGCLIAVLPI